MIKLINNFKSAKVLATSLLALSLIACQIDPNIGDNNNINKKDKGISRYTDVSVNLMPGEDYVEENAQNVSISPKIMLVFSKNINFNNLQSMISLASEDNPSHHIDLIFQNNGLDKVLVTPKLLLANNTSYIVHVSATIQTIEDRSISEKYFKFRTEDSSKLLAKLSLAVQGELYRIDLQFSHAIVGYEQPDAIRIINTSEHTAIPLYSISIDPQNHSKLKILTFGLFKQDHYELLIGDVIKDASTSKNVYNSKLEFTTLSSIVTAKNYATCAIANNNNYCWGDNTSGQLGTGDKINRDKPTLIEQLTTDPTQFYTISVAGNHTCGIDYASYKAYCWGNNTYGQLGTGSNTEYRIQKPINMPENTYFYSIASGGDTTCAIGNNYNTYCWGRGVEGQLGNSQNNNSNIPISVTRPKEVRFFTAISVGNRHVCAIGDNNKVYCWGDNTYGQLGKGDNKNNINVPTQVAIPNEVKNVSTVSAGDLHTCAIADNKVYCWGDNTKGQLGTSDHVNSSTPVLVKMPDNLTNISAISTGSLHTCAIADNIIYCWGDNTKGQLGDNTNIDRSAPTVVNMPSDVKTLSSISLGTNHTCVTSNNNTAYCWGANSNGQLGTGTNDNSNIPVKVIFQ